MVVKRSLSFLRADGAEGLGFRALGLGPRVRAQGLGFKALGLGPRVRV